MVISLVKIYGCENLESLHGSDKTNPPWLLVSTTLKYAPHFCCRISVPFRVTKIPKQQHLNETTTISDLAREFWGQNIDRFDRLPGEPITFIFRGDNPYMGGVKPSFFMVLGSKGAQILRTNKNPANWLPTPTPRRFQNGIFLQRRHFSALVFSDLAKALIWNRNGETGDPPHFCVFW